MGDIYQVKCSSVGPYGVTALNVFWYEATSGPNTAADLHAAWITHHLAQWKACISSAVQLSFLEVLNVTNLADFYSDVIPGGTGTRSGDMLPTYAAWTFKYYRTSRLIRNGSKRIMGVAESDQINGVAVGGFAAAELPTLAAQFGALIGGGGGTIYTPRIVRAVYPVPNPTHLPPISVTAYGIAGVAYSHLGTQNSRKQY